MSADLYASAMSHVATAVEKGQCLLFLGAGVHCAPPKRSPYAYPEEERPPFGSALSERLAEKCNLTGRYPRESPKNLQRTSLFFETMMGRKQLVDEIKSAVQTGKRPSPILRGLAELGFSVVITTNFDQLLERALTDAGVEPHVTVYSPYSSDPADERIDDATAESPWVFKIHGDVAHPESIVITDEDYIQFVLRMTDPFPYHPLPLTLRVYFQKWTTLFLGYSLADYNLRGFIKTLRWQVDPARVPDMYSVDHYPDPLIFDVYFNQRRYVKFIPQDLWTFVPVLYRMVLGREMPDYRA